MAKKYPGFYLYYDWLDAMEHNLALLERITEG